jgi:putative transposase
VTVRFTPRGTRHTGESEPSRPISKAWERFIPFLEFASEVRKIIYTTNAIESLNYQLRKIIKNRGHFPNDDAVIKLLWLAIRDIEDKRARQRAKEKGAPRDQRKAPGKLVEGQAVQGWNQALGALSTAFGERITNYL